MGDLVACVGGPLDGQWFTADDWAARVRAAQRMLDADQRRPPALDYRLTRRTLVHPQQTGVTGQVARHLTA